MTDPKPLSWHDVFGWFDFADIYDEAVATAPPGASLVELGSFFGRSVLYLAEKAREADKGLKVYSVDLWLRRFASEWMFDPNGKTNEALVLQKHETIFQAFAYHVEHSGLDEMVRILRVDTTEAASMFPDESCHFVFVDADHSHAKCLADIRAWYPKVRPGGIIAGHDYGENNGMGVWPAVVEFFGKPAEQRGNSWFWRKP